MRNRKDFKTTNTVANDQTSSQTASVPASADASEWKGNEDLYIIGPSNGFDPQHQFKSQISGIYGVKEYYWTGVIEQGTISFRHGNHHPVPTPADSNHGFTLVGKAMALARGFLIPTGFDISCAPVFSDILINGESRTAIRLSIYVHQLSLQNSELVDPHDVQTVA